MAQVPPNILVLRIVLKYLQTTNYERNKKKMKFTLDSKLYQTLFQNRKKKLSFNFFNLENSKTDSNIITII